ncbi:Alpha-1,4-N-acetylgalactosamine transferase PglH [Candidatus Paraburkholderia kirkii UZHbot1]|uniref:Alpha-1,4-N-acetylgalactosamine transferase PglH n=1 Tax=Candidatus Paraburkholderia kirkii UZHbot1 TaxID=1055526 RepID=G4M6M1_9BURK|nr:Alpha-1,4-N-acetylgalactosamine transferase PglH [Candidatus Paraburkholderia kirkii UZHbot1]
MLFHIVDFGNGGIETSLIQWLRIFDRARFSVTLSVMHPSPAFHDRFRALIPPDVKIEILADKNWLNYFQSRRYAQRLSKLGRIGRDVFNTLAVRPYVKRRVEALARSHALIVDYMSLRRLAGRFGPAWLGVNHFSFDARLGKRERKKRRLAAQFARYDGVAALNEHMAEEVRKMFGGALRRFFVLPNAIDIERIRDNGEAREAPPCDAPYIISVARLDEIQKDHRTLLRAYAELVRSAGIEEHLVIVGDGAFRGELEALAKDFGIGDRVHFAGFRNNPHALVAGARLQVLSSCYEGMPMVLLEALALGKPVIASDCPTGPREILGNGRFGMLFPVGSVDALADALRRLLADESLRARMKERALERAEEYGIAASNERFARCAAELLANEAR